MKRRTLALLGLCSAAGCGQDYLRFVVESSDRSLTSSPQLLDVVVYGAGQTSHFSYTGRFNVPKSSVMSQPFSDFTLTLGKSAAPTIDVRVTVPTMPVQWSGDARVPAAGGTRTVEIPLSLGDREVATARLVDGYMRSSAQFGFGLIYAWADPAGIALQVERDPENPTSQPRVIAPDPLATAVHIASRPRTSNLVPDLAAVVWRGGDGNIALETLELGADHGPFALGPGSDAHVACMPRGGSFDVVAARLDGAQVSAALFSATGTAVGAPLLLSSAEPVRALVGVVSAPGDSFVVATSSDSGARLRRFDAAGAVLANQPVAGQLLGVDHSPDGRVVLATLAGGMLQVGTVDGSTLVAASPPHPVAPFTPPGGVLGNVGVSDCSIIWPEVRGDGSGAIDLRFQYIDALGAPLDVSHLLNSTVDGDHFAPTPVCTAASSAHATFFGRATAAAPTGSLRVRKIPAIPAS